MKRKYTKAELKKYWIARCPECGWKGLSRDCNGFAPIADTGDYDDGTCPRCTVGIVEPVEDIKPRRALWVWRFITRFPKRKEREFCKMLLRTEKIFQENKEAPDVSM